MTDQDKSSTTSGGSDQYDYREDVKYVPFKQDKFAPLKEDNLRLDLERSIVKLLEEFTPAAAETAPIVTAGQGGKGGGKAGLRQAVGMFPPPGESDEMLGDKKGPEWSLGGCTTVMIQHIPSKYSQRKLVHEVNRAGFLGLYDFLYLPVDSRNHANRGFAFVNFVSAKCAQKFHDIFAGQKLLRFSDASTKTLAVVPADVQGYAENVQRYQTSCEVRKHKGHSAPTFFKPRAADAEGKHKNNAWKELKVEPQNQWAEIQSGMVTSHSCQSNRMSPAYPWGVVVQLNL